MSESIGPLALRGKSYPPITALLVRVFLRKHRICGSAVRTGSMEAENGVGSKDRVFDFAPGPVSGFGRSEFLRRRLEDCWMLQYGSRPTARLQEGRIRDHQTARTRGDQRQSIRRAHQICDHLGRRISSEW